MNKQQIFDTVVEHLLSMKDRSAVGGACLYRGPNGAKCAAGVLLPDEYYNEDYEGNLVIDLEYFRENYDHNSLVLLMELQEAHDEKTNWDNGFVGIEDLKNLAAHYDLEWKYENSC